MKLLSMVSTCVGILSPVIGVIIWVFRYLKRKTMEKVLQPTKDIAGKLRVLEMSFNSNKNDLTKIQEKQEQHDIEIKELQTKVDLIIDSKIGKRD